MKSIENLTFIYDRTQENVDRIKELTEKYLNGTITDEEKSEWNDNSKGAFNLSDINRIESNISSIASFLIVFVDTKQWEYENIPRVSDYERIRNNVQSIKDAWVLSNIPEIPEQPLNTYQKWNDIEKILHDVYQNYKRYINSFYYSGTEIYAGEGIGDL